jgi:ribosomal protein S18 acetylase RimI-like enzyme
MHNLQMTDAGMKIRKARVEDSRGIADHLLLAMEDIVYEFIGDKDSKKAKEFLAYFIERQGNQYSYQNCLVIEDGGQILAAVNIYDGAKLRLLRAPVTQYVRTHFNAGFNPEDETQAGEYYIDSLGVSPDQQGKGLGSKILNHLIDTHVIRHQRTLGLLVEEDNMNAQKLYFKLGFKPVGMKILVGKNMQHLQLKA